MPVVITNCQINKVEGGGGIDFGIQFSQGYHFGKLLCKVWIIYFATPMQDKHSLYFSFRDILRESRFAKHIVKSVMSNFFLT